MLTGNGCGWQELTADALLDLALVCGTCWVREGKIRGLRALYCIVDLPFFDSAKRSLSWADHGGTSPQVLRSPRRGDFSIRLADLRF